MLLELLSLEETSIVVCCNELSPLAVEELFSSALHPQSAAARINARTAFVFFIFFPRLFIICVYYTILYKKCQEFCDICQNG